MPWFLCHGDIQIQFSTICRNHTSFSIPFNLAEVTSVSLFSLIMETKIQFDWINFTQLISYMRGQIKPKVRSKSNYPNLSFWYEIRHLGGQIKHKGADQCARQEICMKSIIPASVQSSVWQRQSWHGLLLVAPYLNKGNHDVVVMIGALHLDHLEVPDQDVLMNILARHHFSKESSTTC